MEENEGGEAYGRAGMRGEARGTQKAFVDHDRDTRNPGEMLESHFL